MQTFSVITVESFHNLVKPFNRLTQIEYYLYDNSDSLSSSPFKQFDLLSKTSERFNFRLDALIITSLSYRRIRDTDLPM